MRDYEVMTIHRPELAEDDVDTKVTELEGYLSERGANVTKRDLWGKRRFAYEIEHISEGYYSVVSFQSETDTIDQLDRMLALTDEVLRHKIVRTDED